MNRRQRLMSERGELALPPLGRCGPRAYEQFFAKLAWYDAELRTVRLWLRSPQQSD